MESRRSEQQLGPHFHPARPRLKKTVKAGVGDLMAMKTMYLKHGLASLAIILSCSGCCTHTLWTHRMPGDGVMKPQMLTGGRARWTNDVLEVEYDATWPKVPMWFHTTGKNTLRVTREELEKSPPDPMGAPRDHPRPYDILVTKEGSLPFILVEPSSLSMATAPFPGFECILVNHTGTDNLVGWKSGNEYNKLLRYDWPPGVLTWYKPGTVGDPGKRVTLVRTKIVRPPYTYAIAAVLTPVAVVVDVVTYPIQYLTNKAIPLNVIPIAR
jgi:hypothetical protein